MTDHDYDVGGAVVGLLKAAGVSDTPYSLHGRIHLPTDGPLLLSVPSSLVRGAFDALHEFGAELPYCEDGSLDAHVMIMTKAEVAKIGPSKITERGHYAKYRITKLKAIDGTSSNDFSKLWVLAVRSPELEKLRKSYGLSARPTELPFYVPIAVRKKGVLYTNDVSKSEAEKQATYFLSEPDWQEFDKQAVESPPQDSY